MNSYSKTVDDLNNNNLISIMPKQLTFAMPNIKKECITSNQTLRVKQQKIVDISSFNRDPIEKDNSLSKYPVKTSWS